MSEELSLLRAILERPDDDARKLVYADYLEDQGDPRAEYLRLMVQVRRDRIVTPEQRHRDLSARLAHLSARAAEAWGAGVGSSAENVERERQAQELEKSLRELADQIRQRVPARLQELAAAL